MKFEIPCNMISSKTKIFYKAIIACSWLEKQKPKVSSATSIREHKSFVKQKRVLPHIFEGVSYTMTEYFMCSATWPLYVFGLFRFHINLCFPQLYPLIVCFEHWKLSNPDTEVQGHKALNLWKQTEKHARPGGSVIFFFHSSHLTNRPHKLPKKI